MHGYELSPNAGSLPTGQAGEGFRRWSPGATAEAAARGPEVLTFRGAEGLTLE